MTPIQMAAKKALIYVENFTDFFKILLFKLLVSEYNNFEYENEFLK